METDGMVLSLPSEQINTAEISPTQMVMVEHLWPQTSLSPHRAHRIRIQNTKLKWLMQPFLIQESQGQESGINQTAESVMPHQIESIPQNKIFLMKETGFKMSHVHALIPQKRAPVKNGVLSSVMERPWLPKSNFLEEMNVSIKAIIWKSLSEKLLAEQLQIQQIKSGQLTLVIFLFIQTKLHWSKEMITGICHSAESRYLL